MALNHRATLTPSNGGTPYQLPVICRASPLDPAVLVGTSKRSVLGRRRVHNGCTDPVYVTAPATALFTAARQAELWYDLDGGSELREPSVRVFVDGDHDAVPPVDEVTAIDEDLPTLVRAGGIGFMVQRTLGPDVPGRSRRTGTWPSRPWPVGPAAARA